MVSFCNLEDDINLAEDYLKYVISSIINNCSKELEFFDKFISHNLISNLNKILTTPFYRISYTEAINILLKEIWLLLKEFLTSLKKHTKMLSKKKACVIFINLDTL